MSPPVEPAIVARQLGIALGLGLLVGLQRERSDSGLAGIRTFPLVAVSGFLATLLTPLVPWLAAAGLLALAALLVVGHLTRMQAGEDTPGLTTEAAAVTMYLAGACLALQQTWVAVSVGGGVAVLLHLKPEMRRLVARIGDDDFRAIMQFVLITLVILPVLPNQTYGPYDVLNPFKIWLLVVLIVGLSLAGYVAYKVLGQTAGVWLGGILGGLVSSTATTVGFARRARAESAQTAPAALVIAIASTVVFARVLVVLAVIAPAIFAAGWAPLSFLAAVLMVVCLLLSILNRREPANLPPQGNPSELKSALVFAALFALVLLAVAAARAHLGSQGLYAVAALSGLTDMDAITLSTAEMTRSSGLAAATAWRLILVAALANLVFKAGAVWVMGGAGLFRKTLPYWLTALAGGAVLLGFWPA